MRTKILYIAYIYPPLGGPGVQRPLKTIHYLKKMNTEIDVLTVKNIVFHSTDNSLLKESSADRIIRTFSLDPMSILFYLKKIIIFFKKESQNNSKVYFKTPEKYKKLIRSSFFIDDKVFWIPFAFLKAILLRERYDYIISTIGPYSSAVLGYFLSKAKKIPLIIDYRDHWTLNPYFNYLTSVQSKVSESLEKRILKHSILITAVGNVLLKDLVNKFGLDLKCKMLTIYNGYDEKDFENLRKRNNNKYFTYSYIGNFYGARTPKFFFRAIRELQEEGKFPDKVKIQFVGNYYSEFYKFLDQKEYRDVIEVVPQVEHRLALEYMINSDCLLLFIAEENSRSVITGKLFEYLRAGREILAMIPEDGEAANILRDNSRMNIASPSNVEMIKDLFLKIYYKKSDLSSTLDSNQISCYSRENQTKILWNKIKKNTL